jgi:exopolyphosphatase/guanosine-5'-triphosphate,3'-diphosphate pyrophosphatase
MTSSTRSVRVAAIDLGTNAFRLLIADVAADRRWQLHQVLRTIPRLGEGVGRTGRLSLAAIERALAALRDFRSLIERDSVDAVVAVATSAVREAENAARFLELVKAEIGFDVEVISGTEEARRTWLGVQAGFSDRDQMPTDAVVLDIGGGSTEIMRIRRGRLDGEISLDLGVVKLRERFVRHDPPSAAELLDLETAVRDALQGAASLRDGMNGCPVIGTAGTVTTAAALYLKLSTYEPSRLHETVVPRVFIEEIAVRLARMTTVERRKLPTLEPGREDVIVAGLAILRLILDAFEAPAVQVSEYGLREGLIVEWAERPGHPWDLRSART